MSKYIKAIECLEKRMSAGVTAMNFVLQHGANKEALDKLMKERDELEEAIDILKEVGE